MLNRGKKLLSTANANFDQKREKQEFGNID
jgi:hypothetical protein